MSVKLSSTTLLAALILNSISAADSAGIASQYHKDDGLEKDPKILFFESFESENPVFYKSSRKISDKQESPFGKRVLSSKNIKGKHLPWDIHHQIPESDCTYYRFYTKFEKDYDFGLGVKGPGIGARVKGKTPGGGAGIKPKGNDKYGGRICFNKNGEPYVYYYHMNMGRWGSNAKQNIGDPVSIKQGQLHCLEMMIKANDEKKKDGEIKMWVDGVLKVHTKDIQFRTTTSLKINWINHSAYFGGNWTSPKNQYRYEDNMAAATTYIGPATLK